MFSPYPWGGIAAADYTYFAWLTRRSLRGQAKWNFRKFPNFPVATHTEYSLVDIWHYKNQDARSLRISSTNSARAIAPRATLHYERMCLQQFTPHVERNIPAHREPILPFLVLLPILTYYCIIWNQTRFNS